MKPEHLHTLQHSLGVDQYGQGEQYRNYFIASPGSTNFQLCCELVALGLMRDKGTHPILPAGDRCFSVTDEGKAAMREHSPKPPKLTRSQKRYRDWLKADCGIPFREWIKLRKEAA